MPTERLNAELRDGHKERAAEVPFDPRARWAIGAEAPWPGQRGFRVRARLNDTVFETAIVSRSRKFWLLVPADIAQSPAVSVGESACLDVSPLSAPKPSA